MEWLAANWQLVLTVISYVVAGASLVVAGVAPLTKSEADNKLLKVLRWLEKALEQVPLVKPGNPKEGK